MAKIATNNKIFLLTKLFSFFILRNIYPQMSFNIIDLLDNIICERIIKKAIDISKAMQFNIKIYIKNIDKNIN